MKRQQVEVMASIEKIEKKQGLLLQKIRSIQQQLFQVFGQRYLLKQKMMHRHLEQVVEFLPGTFAHTALYTLYLTVCLEMKIELNPEEHPLLKRLIEWSDMFPSLRELQTLPLIDTVSPMDAIASFSCFQEYIVYLNFIGADLLKLILRSKVDDSKLDRIKLSHIKPDELMQFLTNSLPKMLFNIILPVDVLPPGYRDSRSMEILYRATDLEFFMKNSPNYTTLIKIMVKIMIRLELTQAQQRTMMEIVFRYFYCYHHDKKYGSTDIFIQAYNALHQSVRYAMADQFVLFFRCIRKIGKNKFSDFLLSKSEWLNQIDKKVSEGNFVGYSKQALNPFPNLKVWDTFVVPNGKIEYKTLEVLQNFSLFYFVIDVPSHDITIRLNYLGDFNDQKPSCVQLLHYEKRKGTLKANIMAAKKGFYQFEFDNSYSWMNSKTVKMEKLVLMPLEFSSPDTPSWVDSYYEGITLNQVTDKSKIHQITRKEPPKESFKYDGVANITRNGTFFNLKISRGNGIYEFETESQDKLLKKFNQIVDLGTKIKWMVAGEQLVQPGQIEERLKTSKEEEKQNETEERQPQQLSSISTAPITEPEEKPEEQSRKTASKKQEEIIEKEKSSPKQKKKKSQKKELQ